MWKNLKEHNACEKYYVSNLTTCSSENDKYLGSITKTTATVTAKTVPTNFNKKGNL